MQYGLVVAKRSGNLGDDIQSLAARRFLPTVDEIICRDRISDSSVTRPTKAILNGWYLHNTRYWPPNKNIDPLFISFHARPARASNSIEWICNKVIGKASAGSCTDSRFAAYYRRHTTIGCRDTATCNALQSIGVPSFFSGCLTLALPPSSDHGHREGVLFVDPFSSIPGLTFRPDLWAQLPRALRSNAERMTHFHASNNLETRLKRAGECLDRYRNAALVITSRLHVALPCIAFRTPVIFLNTNYRVSRLSGYEGILTSMPLDRFYAAARSDTLLAEVPQVNYGLVEQLAQKLETHCRNFISSRRPLD